MPTEKKPRKSLFDTLKRKYLETFPETDADVDDLRLAGFAYPVLIMFHIIFFGSLVGYSFYNIKQNLSQTFLSPEDQGQGTVCNDVPVAVNSELYVDRYGIWSTETEFSSGAALYSLKLEQAKYNGDPVDSFNDEIRSFQETFDVQAQRGKERDFGWNLVMGASYQETRSDSDGELLTGIATFSLQFDGDTMIDDVAIVANFANIDGYCTVQGGASYSDGYFSMTFQQRFKSEDDQMYYDNYVYNYALDDTTRRLDSINTIDLDGAYVAPMDELYDPKPRKRAKRDWQRRKPSKTKTPKHLQTKQKQANTRAINRDIRALGDRDRNVYDFNYYYLTQTSENFRETENIFIQGKLCEEIINSDILGSSVRNPGDSGITEVTLEIDFTSIFTAVAVNYGIIGLSELSATSSKVERIIRTSFGELKPGMYFDPYYVPMDPILCFIDELTYPDITFPFCLVKMGNTYAYPSISSAGYVPQDVPCGLLEECTCGAMGATNYNFFCYDMNLFIGLVYYEDTSNFTSIVNFARNLILDADIEHFPADYDKNITSRIYRANRQAIFSLVTSGTHRFNHKYTARNTENNYCGNETTGQAHIDAFAEFCSDNCSLLTFLVYDESIYYQLNDNGLSVRSLQCTDTLYKESVFDAMVDTPPDVTFKQDYVICSNTYFNAISTGLCEIFIIFHMSVYCVANAFASASFYSSTVLLVVLFAIVQGYNYYTRKKMGRKYFITVEEKDRVEKDTVRALLRRITNIIEVRDEVVEGEKAKILKELDALDEMDHAGEEEAPALTASATLAVLEERRREAEAEEAAALAEQQQGMELMRVNSGESDRRVPGEIAAAIVHDPQYFSHGLVRTGVSIRETATSGDGEDTV